MIVTRLYGGYALVGVYTLVGSRELHDAAEYSIDE